MFTAEEILYQAPLALDAFGGYPRSYRSCAA